MQKHIKIWWENKTNRQNLFYIYLGLVLFLTLLPSRELKPSFLDGFIFSRADKIAHVILFFLLAYLQDKAFYLKISLKILILLAIGWAIEIIQERLNWGRSFEWNDLLADGIGILSYFLSIKILRLKKFKINQ